MSLSSRRSSSDSDVEVYNRRDVFSSSHLGTTSGGNVDVDAAGDEEAGRQPISTDTGRPSHVRRRSGSSIRSAELEEPFTRGERLFMITSVVMVAGLTIAAVTVVLMGAKL